MKPTVAVFFGGRSAEHDVSIITAHVPIIEALRAGGVYEPVAVYIAKSGAWYSDPALLDLAFFQDPAYEQRLAQMPTVSVRFDEGLTLEWPGRLKTRRQTIDIAFPAMHGTFGEDGTLMGLLRLAGIPFVGCDLEASAVAMDKVLTKQVTQGSGVPSVPYAWFTAADWPEHKARVLKSIKPLKYPLFVKPVHLGSSIAITKVDTPAELENAIEVALHYDDKVIVEQGVQDLIEVTLPLMGNATVEFALVERPNATFFGFDEKYLGGGKKSGGSSQYSELPARIDDKLTGRVKELAEATYRAIGASGLARIDFLIDAKTQEVYMNEVNTLPGSLYHHNWRAAGVSSVQLVNRLIDLARERHAEHAQKAFVFNSPILSQVRGQKQQS